MRRSAPHASRRVLLAETDPMTIVRLERALLGEGFRAETVTDGLTAAERALSGDHRLVLTELALPGLHGLGVLDRIRAADPYLPVIVLSGSDELADVVGAFDHGADDYLAKPFRTDELLARMRLRLRTGCGAPRSRLPPDPSAAVTGGRASR